MATLVNSTGIFVRSENSLHKALQGSHHTQVIEDGRVQLICNMSGLFRCLDYARPQIRNTALRALERREIGRKPFNVQGHGSKLLADLIVQLTRHSSSLLFLSCQETGRQSLNLLRVCPRSLLHLLPLGDIAHKSDAELARRRRDDAQANFDRKGCAILAAAF